MADIPIDAESGSVICQQSITWGKASPSMTLTARLLAVDEAGEEHLLGRYVPSHANDPWATRLEVS